MGEFYLIQRGKLKKEGNELFGENGIANLDYMGSAEFEFGAIPKAYRRLMYNFLNYEIFHTDIFTSDKKELIIFCRKEYSKEILKELKNYVYKPYKLKEYSELDNIYLKNSNKNLRSNFWWCIDCNNVYGDWMAFLDSNIIKFFKSIKNDYQNWWLSKPLEKREEDYKLSLKR